MSDKTGSTKAIRQLGVDAGFLGPRFLGVEPGSCVSSGAADVIVVGGGVAGLCAALEAASGGASVLIVSKRQLSESNTRYAQGGIAAVFGDDDSFERHGEDTIRAGAGLCHRGIVDFVIRSGPAAIQQLVEYGSHFDQESGRAALGREGGHSRGRVVHSRGDATGLEVQSTLEARVRADQRIRILEHTFAVDIATIDGSVCGLITVGVGKKPALFRCRALVLASGGAGRLYRETTNPQVATGDGIAMAFRAGARLRGLEFFQFHPTTLYVPGVPRLLISETVRGEGGVLRDRHGERFMLGEHPQAELAPRDVVSRAIVKRIKDTDDTCSYLDVSHLDATKFRKRFPGISRVLDEYSIDFSRGSIPVHPAAHYQIGGVLADAEGRTSVDGLYAVGEVASTGLHGANRLGSNSLLEGLVCGGRAGRLAASALPSSTGPYDEGVPPADIEPSGLNRNDLWNSLRSVMWKHVAITRNATGLRAAVEQLARWSDRLFRTRFDDVSGFELVNAMTVSRLVAAGSTHRLESRGTHYREDCPERSDEKWCCDLNIRRGD